MSLDFSKTVQQITHLSTKSRAEHEDFVVRTDLAIETMRSSSWDAIESKQISAGSRPYLWAKSTESFGSVYPLPPSPTDFCIAATDGSHIDVDRHLPVACALINTGTCLLRYGSDPYAHLSNTPRLYYGDELYITQQNNGIHEIALEGSILGTYRTVEEMKALVSLLRSAPLDIPVLGLMDGSLVLFTALQQGQPKMVEKFLLDDGFLQALSEIHLMARHRPLSVASYISLPRSSEVVSALRLYLCDQGVSECHQVCSRRRSPHQNCSLVNHLKDRDLFENLLKPGERSALFISQSEVIGKYPDDQKIFFFYLNTGEEISRIEVPRWVAYDESLLSLTHSLIMDQCSRGLGYPVAISEAHEQAVINGSDRQRFNEIFELLLHSQGTVGSSSAKSRSKRTAWI
ncbi:DNA double-strand break repair nuclease NurA [SAR202 cluster bacterium AD-804-J14_MRT_500m]|nr:DNA double-strand break repair nuclease NurA [SAR202 cluster bacterium AD-804-J14_MRT_500m]